MMTENIEAIIAENEKCDPLKDVNKFSELYSHFLKQDEIHVRNVINIYRGAFSTTEGKNIWGQELVKVEIDLSGGYFPIKTEAEKAQDGEEHKSKSRLIELMDEFWKCQQEKLDFPEKNDRELLFLFARFFPHLSPAGISAANEKLRTELRLIVALQEEFKKNNAIINAPKTKQELPSKLETMKNLVIKMLTQPSEITPEDDQDHILLVHFLNFADKAPALTELVKKYREAERKVLDLTLK